jgi:hypothetical protein
MTANAPGTRVNKASSCHQGSTRAAHTDPELLSISGSFFSLSFVKGAAVSLAAKSFVANPGGTIVRAVLSRFELDLGALA